MCNQKSKHFSRQSYWALNGANFFLAQIAAGVGPFFSVFLREHNWRYDNIGFALAAAGLASLGFQIPAGIICDKTQSRRFLLATVAILLGLCYGIFPSIVESVNLVFAVLFISGCVGSFLAPVLASLGLELAGYAGLDRIIAANRSWTHAGDLVALISALAIVRFHGIEPLFAVAILMSLLAAICANLIRRLDLDTSLLKGERIKTSWAMAFHWMKDKRIQVLLLSITLFQVANAPLRGLLSLYMGHLGCSYSKIASIALVAEPFMIPVAWFTGRIVSTWGRKLTLAIALGLLPLRLILYALTTNANILLAITTIDGIISGIYGVVIMMICSDFARHSGHFNFLIALTSLAPSLGEVLGATLQGVLTQYLGFISSFIVLALVATSGVAIFWTRMPETMATE